MMRSFLYAVACALFAAVAIASSAHAATPSQVLTVESVLPPAWIERANGRREPLAVGMALSNGEKVHTGDGGKAMLRLSEGSAVKLGESGMMVVSDLLERKDAKRRRPASCPPSRSAYGPPKRRSIPAQARAAAAERLLSSQRRRQTSAAPIYSATSCAIPGSPRKSAGC